MTFQPLIDKIENEEHKQKYVNILNWVDENYPQLDKAIKWNHPSYENEGTFIIAITPFKGHIAINLEKVGIDHFAEEIENSPYDKTEMTFKVKWKQEIDFELLERMIEFQIEDKKGLSTYWRK